MTLMRSGYASLFLRFDLQRIFVAYHHRSKAANDNEKENVRVCVSVCEKVRCVGVCVSVCV
jgi:hypothetical protein